MEVEANYDEAAVGEYTLPEIWPDPPRSVEDRIRIWPERRKEILAQFETVLYGRFPRDNFSVSSELFEEGDMIPGEALRKQYRLTFTNPRSGAAKSMDVLLVTPAGVSKAPCLCALNFWGNHSTTDCPEIPVNPNWMRWDEKLGYTNHRAEENTRGVVSHRWPYRQIVEAGFAAATAYYGDIYPDCNKGRREGLAALFDHEDDETAAGSIGYWAWGLCAMRKFLTGLESIQSDRIHAVGHSRLGKTALWAAANDERFAGAMSNDSGCAGASLSRRNFGETPGWMAGVIPWWFRPGFVRHADHPHDWPVDQHMLLATIAPRPLLVTSAVEDTWADPRGEELSAVHASSLYAFLEGTVDSPVSDGRAIASKKVRYQIRPGDHDMLPADWAAALEHFSED
ncbi:MAG: acetylxylan esterase [Phycisphaerae bacterium]|nr:acetylxylan esterase [Phycisphaerae bacterium]